MQLAGLLAVVAVTWIQAAPLAGLRPWVLTPDRSYWVKAVNMNQPRRLIEGERAAPAWALPRAPGAAVYQATVLLDAPPPGQRRLTFLAPSVSGTRSYVFINGVRLIRPLSLGEPPMAAPWGRPILSEASERYLRPGPNRIDMLVEGAVGPPLSGPILMGPLDELAIATDPEKPWAGAGRRILAELGLAVAGVAVLAAALERRRRRSLLALSALASVVAARALLSDIGLIEGLGPAFGFLDRLLVGLGLLAVALLMIGRRPLSPPIGWAGGLGAALGLIWLLDASTPYWAPILSTPAAMLAVLLPLAAVPLAIHWTGGWRWRGSTARKARVAGTASVLGGILVLTAWSGLGMWIGLSGMVLNVAYLATAVGGLSLAALAAGHGMVTGSAVLVTERLDQAGVIRRQREQISAATEALESEMRRRAILEERQRLARDMHDGVGGQLVSLIARVRSRRITVEQVESELMQGLSELRLVVDSLDATGQSLTEALLGFRLRAQAQSEGASMRLEWSQSELGEVEIADPRWVLTLYRFMQEAVTNAARHSGGQTLSVRIARSGDSRLTVEIADNGRGFDPDQPPGGGKGLRNLAVRAGQLGGGVTFKPRRGGGMRVVLDAPLPETA